MLMHFAQPEELLTKLRYHSAKDDRLPRRFNCFDCRVKADISWELIKVDLYPTMISKYKELALFRFESP